MLWICKESECVNCEWEVLSQKNTFGRGGGWGGEGEEGKSLYLYWALNCLSLYCIRIVSCRFSYGGGGSRSNSESRGRHRSSHSRSMSPRSLSRSVSPANNGRTAESAKSSKTNASVYGRSHRENGGREPLTHSSRYGYNNNGQLVAESSEATKRRYEGVSALAAEAGKRLASGGRSSSRSRSASSSQHD